MTLDEAIKHCEDVADDRCGCAEDCVNEHRQLAEWLKELKAYRIADTPQTDCDKCIWNVCNYNKVDWDADTPQHERSE